MIEIKLNVSEELLGESKSWKPWRAEDGDEYFMIWSKRNCLIVYEHNDDYDDYKYLTGNYYQTKEKAEQANLISEAKGRLNFKMLELNEGWTPDWADDQQNKYSLYHDHLSKKWKIVYYSLLQHFVWPYFPTKQLANQFREEMESDLNLMFSINKKIL